MSRDQEDFFLLGGFLLLPLGALMGMGCRDLDFLFVIGGFSFLLSPL